MPDKRLTLAHGNGGRLTRELIETIFAPAFNNPDLDTQSDAARFLLTGASMMTTDCYTVDPLFFPGGDIGKLAVCGTVNDLSVSGAVPRYMSVNFLLEEGLEFSVLESVVTSMAEEARSNAVSIITGDTKVLPKGMVEGMYIVTTGIGSQICADISISNICSGDNIFVSGSVGDHGAAVFLARAKYGLQGSLQSDCASISVLAAQLMGIPGLKFMRDPTRGGLATVCHEIIRSCKLGVRLVESVIPLKPEVQAYCDILGLNPYYLASEGRIVFVVDDQVSIDDICGISDDIHCIGKIEEGHGNLVLQTDIGGTRIIPELDSDPLPRIC